MPSHGIQVAVTGEITATDLSDTFAVTNPYWGLGGLRLETDLIARDAITVPRREEGMLVYVASNKHYYKLEVGLTNLDWTDLGLSLGGSSVSIIDITKAALSALISGSSVVKGQIYAITDFQDKDTSDTNSRVIVLGTSTNTISKSGHWLRLSQNKPFSSLILSSGAAGNISQITVGATNLMTATVNYVTSRFVTLTNVATNINANSGVSGYRAIVIQGQSVVDQPAMIIESITANVNTSTVTVTATTLVTTQVSVMGMGKVQSQQVLDIDYDLSSDRITRCFDQQFGCEMVYNPDIISTLTYNPIVQFRWGHANFRGWKIVNTDYTNVFITSSITGVNQVEQNNIFTGGTFKNLLFRRVGPVPVSISDNVWTPNISNLVVIGVVNNLNGNQVQVVLNNITVNQLIVQKNIGAGLATFGTCSFTTALNLNNNVINGTVSFTGANYSFTTLAIGLNTISPNITINTTATSSYTQSVTINGNYFYGNLVLPPGTVNFVISMLGNRVHGMVMNTLSFSVAGKTLSIAGCDIYPSFAITGAKTDNFTLSSCSLGPGTNITGNHGVLNISNSNILAANLLFSTSTSIVINRSYLDNTSNISMIGGGTVNIVSSHFKASSINSCIKADIQGSNFIGCTFINTKSEIIDSFLRNTVISNNDVHIDNSNIQESILAIYGTGSNFVYIQNSEIFNSPVTLGSTTSGTTTLYQSTINQTNFYMKAANSQMIGRVKAYNSIWSTEVQGDINSANIDMLNLDYANCPNFYPDEDITVSNCSFKQGGFDWTIPDLFLRNLVIDNYTFSIKYTHIYSDFPVTVGSPFLITHLPTGTCKNKITYTSAVAALVGSSVRIATPSGAEFLTTTSCAAINSQATQDDGTLDVQTVLEELNLYAVGGNTTGGILTILAQGTMLQDF